MKEYLFAVAGAVLISAIVAAIAPEGKISGAVKTAAKLLCLTVISQPIARYFVKLKNGESVGIFAETVITEDESFIKYCSEAKIAETKKLLEAEILEKYGAETEVTFDWAYEDAGTYGAYTEKGIRIRKISIALSENVAAETRETIQSDTEEKYGAPVEITVKAAEEKAGDKRDGD